MVRDTATKSVQIQLSSEETLLNYRTAKILQTPQVCDGIPSQRNIVKDHMAQSQDNDSSKRRGSTKEGSKG